MNVANISQRMKYPPVSSREYPAEGMHTLIRLLHSRPNVSSSFRENLGLRIQANSSQQYKSSPAEPELK